jgi:Uncharacterized protein conserved in bacteria (DUF2188)
MIKVEGLQYFVSLQEGKWRITLQDTNYGPFKSRSHAIRIAIDAANKWGKNGHDAQVFVQVRNNEWRIEWTYTHAPYLPAA